MNFTHYDLGGLGKGRTVEVLLQGNAANVYLMDHENMIKYNRKQPFQAMGGLMTFSPIRLQTIEAAHWHLVIDLPKGYGTVKTSYRLLNKQMPNISTRLTTFTPTDAQKKSVAGTGILSKKTPQGEKPAAAPPPKPAAPDEISCKSCGILTRRGKFCTTCGAPMEKVCLKCSAVNAISDMFCSECGQGL